MQMKNIKIFVLVCIMAMPSSIPLICSCSKKPPVGNGKGYTIDYRENGMIVVVAHQQDSHSDMAKLNGYGTALNKAVEEVMKTHEISQIIPYVYDSHRNSYTKKLLIIAKPKPDETR
jgi:hypothetical protein